MSTLTKEMSRGALCTDEVPASGEVFQSSGRRQLQVNDFSDTNHGPCQDDSRSPL